MSVGTRGEPSGRDEVRRGRPRVPRPRAVPLLLGLVAGIVLLDVSVSAGVAVGILLAVPILLASTTRGRGSVLAVGGAALLGKVVDIFVGGAPITPPEFWVPNRILVLLLVVASTALSLHLQRGRLAAEAARDAAVKASGLNQLLMSLLAHDLRAPLVVARQCIGYVADSLARGTAPDPDLLAHTATRLDRSLRAIEIVLVVARRDAPGPEGASDPEHPLLVRDVLEQELESFRGEAALQGKRLEARLDHAGDHRVGSHLLVLRQSVAILLDNAIRYAVPGEVVVTAKVEAGTLRVSVSDPGPPAEGAPMRELPRGAGLGLELSGALLSHAGGTLAREGNGKGTTWTLGLPLAPSEPAGVRGAV